MKDRKEVMPEDVISQNPLNKMIYLYGRQDKREQ